MYFFLCPDYYDKLPKLATEIGILTKAGCLDDTSTHKTAMWHFDMHKTSTQSMVCCDFYGCDTSSLYLFTTVTLWLCNVLLLLHFHPVMFYYCNISTPVWYVQETDVRPASKVDVMSRWTSCHCVRISTFFYLDFDRTSYFSLKQMWTFCHKSLGDSWKCFGLVGRGGVTKCHNGQMSNQGLIMAHTDPWIG